MQLTFREHVEKAHRDNTRFSAVSLIANANDITIALISDNGSRHDIASCGRYEPGRAANEAQAILNQLRERDLLVPVQQLDTSNVITVRHAYCSNATAESAQRVKDSYLVRTQKSDLGMTAVYMNFMLTDVRRYLSKFAVSEQTEVPDSLRVEDVVGLVQEVAEGKLIDALDARLSSYLKILEDYSQDPDSESAVPLNNSLKAVARVYNAATGMNAHNETLLATGIETVLNDADCNDMKEYLERFPPRLDNLESLSFVSGVLGHASDAGVIHQVGSVGALAKNVNAIGHLNSTMHVDFNENGVLARHQLLEASLGNLTEALKGSALLASLDHWQSVRGQEILSTPAVFDESRQRYVMRTDELEYRSELSRVNDEPVDSGPGYEC